MSLIQTSEPPKKDPDIVEGKTCPFRAVGQIIQDSFGRTGAIEAPQPCSRKCALFVYWGNIDGTRHEGCAIAKMAVA